MQPCLKCSHYKTRACVGGCELKNVVPPIGSEHCPVFDLEIRLKKALVDGKIEPISADEHRIRVAKELQDVINLSGSDDSPASQIKAAIGFMVFKFGEIAAELDKIRDFQRELDDRTHGMVRFTR